MPTKKKSDEIKKEVKTGHVNQLEQQLIDQYVRGQYTDVKIDELPSELEYMPQTYTLADLQSHRDKLKEIATHVTDIHVSNEQLIDLTKPVSIVQFLFAGVVWHNWYLNQLEAPLLGNDVSAPLLGNTTIPSWKSVHDMREFMQSFEPFVNLFNAMKEADILNRTDLTDLAKLTLRHLTFYYFNKCFVFDPLLLFKQMLSLTRGVYMCSFLQEELAVEDEKTIANLITTELLKEWHEQQLLIFRVSNHSNFTIIPYAIRTMMYRRSRSISMNNIIKAMNEWMDMRLRDNLQRFARTALF